MKKYFQISYLILIGFFISSCNSVQNLDNTFDDGTYCATVEYENPNTGTMSTYNLNVDVEDNSVICIHFPNGGYLDEDHFDPAELDEDGTCSFESDEENEYTITITGEECPETDLISYTLDLINDKEEVTCPKCGNEKDSFDDYCDDCEDRIEHTCPICGNYDSGMYSFDDKCTDCQEKEDEKEEKEFQDLLNDN